MKPKKKLKVIDLFCGIGGLSHGLIKEGLDVVAGIDNDNSCKFGYEYNNKAKFIHRDILDVGAKEINQLFGDKNKTIRVLVGCAPCQPFSRLNLKQITEKQLEPLEKFARLIKETLPDIVSMENVSGLADIKKYPIFKTFIDTLGENGYKYKYEIVNVSDYGVPQSRKRLVLLASRFGEIELIKRTHENKKVTVRDVIKNLEPIDAGEVSKSDPLHKARKLSPTNLKRIKSTPHNGGGSRSWDKSLILDCHKKDSGKTYRGTVYGRMRWDKPAPTMTTQCVGLGNGRFGHPEQDRAISLREAAIFQTFPK
ncbi:DNA cytosine methyltransferase, partial [Patescibacteria group bacterium]|nr:DNA cytosine methyltransferase [Patescibacteria group bacterium]